MAKYMNPFIDVAFKRLFGQESSKVSLIAFLNDLLAGERQVETIEYMNKEQLPETDDGRLAVFDILCREKDGTQFIVEMQNSPQAYFYDRGLFYLCRAVSSQGVPGSGWMFDIYPVYGIYFLNFLLPELSKLRTDVVLADRDTGEEVVGGKLRQIYLCLPHFRKEARECKNDYERWIYLIKNMKTLERNPFEAAKVKFGRFLDVAEIENLSPLERMRYEEKLKSYRDYVNTISFAEEKGIMKGILEGRKEGLEEGRKEGRLEGRKEGRKEGLEKGLRKGEAQKARQIALVMKQKGYPIDMIADSTGLSPDEIGRLREP